MLTNYKIGIKGVGRKLPKNVLTNEHLEQMVDTSDEWICQLTGIRTRHIIGEDESILSLATAAARDALKSAGVDAWQIRYIRIGVNTHNRFPSLASYVQQDLGIDNASAADISAGCSSFIFSVEDVYNRLIADKVLRGEHNHGLVIGADALSLVTDWTNRQTCVLLGDGAGAVVIGPVQTGEILATFTRTQAQYSNLLFLDEFLSVALEDKDSMKMKHRNGTAYPVLQMEGRKVFAVAVRTMMSDIKAVIERYNRSNGGSIKLSDIEYVIPHQANLRIVAAVQEGLKLGPDQVYRDGVINYGNTSAASIPIGYVDEWGKHPGALEVDVAFGAGFASGAILRRAGI